MSEFIRADVTAVKFFKNHILAGIGSQTHVYSKDSLNFITKFNSLIGQKIYGFVPHQCDHEILVFGGKQFTVLFELKPHNGGDDFKFQRLFQPIVCDDWIHSALWISEDLIALLTAHNVLQTWDIRTLSLVQKYPSRDNSILYSGLLVTLKDDVLIFAGTVFSEILIRTCDDQLLHQLKGHRGVIFSISCDLEKDIIVSTSDDRSVRIWGPKTSISIPSNTRNYWKKVEIVCRHELYGHLARVMRNCITNNSIISIGEDAGICLWSFDGKLIRKTVSHQNGAIWSLDSDFRNLVTGGGDCGVIIHPLLTTDCGENETLDIIEDIPKKIVFTARRNIVIITNSDDFIYYNVETKIKDKFKVKHESTFKLLSVSSCKQIIATCDMFGNFNVYVENCKGYATIQNVISTKINIGKVLSMQWAGNRYIIFCSDNGVLTVLASKLSDAEVVANFSLPPCKERWLTSAAVAENNRIFVVGDRCGNIHLYLLGFKDPIKTFHRVHGRYGPTSIVLRDNEMITTGRNGSIKYFLIENSNNLEVKSLSKVDLKFHWVEKFLDKDFYIICGFQERDFVVYNLKDNSKILEVACGGGHRCWDAVRYFQKDHDEFVECIKLIFINKSKIHVSTFEMDKIASRNIVHGSHPKEINCLKSHKVNGDEGLVYFITGGEDTTIRISCLDAKLYFKDIKIYKQLSNVRALKIFRLAENILLLTTAGGRAQICIKILTFNKRKDNISVQTEDVVDYLIKGSDKERKVNKTWRDCIIDFDPETRVMDLDVFKANNDNFIIYTGCSDALLRVFKLTLGSNNRSLEFIKEISHHKTCILKTICMKIHDKCFLATCTTRGEITIWNGMINDSAELKTILTVNTNKNGINSFAYICLSNSKLLLTTGGDDNAIHFVLINIIDETILEILENRSTDEFHCSQITGLIIIEDYLISTSIDQRISLLKWSVNGTEIQWEFVSQAYSDVADIQGIDLMSSNSDSIMVCVFGKGLEIVRLDKLK